MDENIIFIVKNKMGYYNKRKISYLTSEYLKKYKNNREDIRKRNSWKTQGISSSFRGESRNNSQINLDNILNRATINGITFIDSNKIAYSLCVDNFSGIFIKNPNNDSEIEAHVIHNDKLKFYNIDYNSGINKLVTAMQELNLETNIAIFDIEKSDYIEITEGDTIDNNPVWCKTDSSVIYFDSKGIARNGEGYIIQYAPKVINKIDLDSGELTELVSIPKYDCFLPKADNKGNLYFIKKPFKVVEEKSASIFEILLIPFKILKAIYNWIEFFTVRYTGEYFSSKGANPAKSKQLDPKTVFINGNMINAEQSLKENKQKGEKYPGIAPRSWELMKLDNEKNIHSIKKGVLAYDINSNGEVIYSNGKYLIKMDKDSKEEVLETQDLIGCIKAM